MKPFSFFFDEKIDIEIDLKFFFQVEGIVEPLTRELKNIVQFN